jgi:hypothetical protein
MIFFTKYPKNNYSNIICLINYIYVQNGSEINCKKYVIDYLIATILNTDYGK